jgi:hypothetical protein
LLLYNSLFGAFFMLFFQADASATARQDGAPLKSDSGRVRAS